MKHMTYEDWIKQVDVLLIGSIGLSTSDLRDRCWRDSYEAGFTPGEAMSDVCGDLSSEEGMEAFMLDELFG